jgi:hypothetical protein
MEEIDFRFVLKIFIVILFLFLLFAFINYLGINLYSNKPLKLLRLATIEGLTTENLTNPKPDTSIIQNKSDAFCEHHRGSSHILEQSCGKLTQDNCNSTSCCVWTSNNKCVAGKANGPTFNTDKNGKTNNLDYYYYQNKCYGSKCS